MARAVTICPCSQAFVAYSLILIASSTRTVLYELTEALEGISSSDTWLAVDASILSAVIGLTLLAWAIRLRSTMLS